MLPTPVTIFSLMRTKDEEALARQPTLSRREKKKIAGGFDFEGLVVQFARGTG